MQADIFGRGERDEGQLLAGGCLGGDRRAPPPEEPAGGWRVCLAVGRGWGVSVELRMDENALGLNFFLGRVFFFLGGLR